MVSAFAVFAIASSWRHHPGSLQVAKCAAKVVSLQGFAHAGTVEQVHPARVGVAPVASAVAYQRLVQGSPGGASASAKIWLSPWRSIKSVTSCTALPRSRFAPSLSVCKLRQACNDGGDVDGFALGRW